MHCGLPILWEWRQLVSQINSRLHLDAYRLNQADPRSGAMSLSMLKFSGGSSDDGYATFSSSPADVSPS